MWLVTVRGEGGELSAITNVLIVLQGVRVPGRTWASFKGHRPAGRLLEATRGSLQAAPSVDTQGAQSREDGEAGRGLVCTADEAIAADGDCRAPWLASSSFLQ